MVDDVVEESAKEEEHEDASEEVVRNGYLARGSEELTQNKFWMDYVIEKTRKVYSLKYVRN